MDFLISVHHRGSDFCTLIGGVSILESLIFFTFYSLGTGTLEGLSFYDAESSRLKWGSVIPVSGL